MTIQEDSEMFNNLPEALELYRTAWLVLTNTEILVAEIDVQEIELGLIGPGNGCLTSLLEILFRYCSTFQLVILMS